MKSIKARPTCQTLCAAAVTAALFSTPVLADDIDVYTSQISAQQRPNLLFVLDYSGSMQDSITNADGTSSSKISVLKAAMNNLLDANFNRLNVGLGSMYSDDPTGIKWPVSPLDGNASDVDASIIDTDPLNPLTSKDILLDFILNKGASGSTATVDALVEAAQYFSGSPVTHDDNDMFYVNRHRPAIWDNPTEEYIGGDARASHPMSYTPSTAFQYGVNLPGYYSYCNIDDIDASIAENTDGDDVFDLTGADPNSWCLVDSKAFYDCNFNNAHGGGTYEGGSYGASGAYLSCKYEHEDAWVTPDYVSPIANECQANAIVLISDGRPTTRNENASLDAMAGMPESSCEDLSSSIFSSVSSNNTDGNCGPEIVKKLATTPQINSITDSFVKTYTVGFDVEDYGKDYLQRLAFDGDGKFFNAENPSDLTTALDEIIFDVLGGSESFTELSIDISKANFSHDNRTYFSLFEPSGDRHWQGNLKGYYLNNSGLKDLNDTNATAISSDGILRFADTAQSFWSDTVDGDEVTAGGANEQLAGATRNIYTYTEASIPGIGVDLSSSADYKLESANTKITEAMLGLPGGSSLRDAHADWIHSAPMGAPLHSKVVAIDYPTQRVVYIMTNQGLLHAIDATKPTAADPDDSTGGEELFAFMPKRLLSNIARMNTNDPADGHIYGLDGQITPWHDDSNNDGIVNNSETVLLVFGMRRGGDSYYAMDVTDPASPKLMWEINSSQTDFADLGETWSRMSLITVNKGGTDTDVLAFGGGYDAATLDGETARIASKGSAIYMIDRDGSRVWKTDASNHSDMKYAIPSDLTIIDSDADGKADRIYVGDFGGQVWRVDFDDINNTPVTTLFADIDDGDHQPFFYPPSVAYNQATPSNFLSITLGSGNRTNPMLEGQVNNFYMLRDLDTEKGAPSGSSTKITNSNLYDTTNNNVSSLDATISQTARDALAAAKGWKVALNSGEKSLSSVVTFEGKVLATTFQVDTVASADPCNFVSQGSLYIMDLKTGKPIQFFADGSQNPATLVAADRKKALKTSGIPSSPQIIFPADDPNGPTNVSASKVQVIVGRESLDLINKNLLRVYWHAK